MTTALIFWPIADASATSMKWVALGGSENELLWGVTQDGVRSVYDPAHGTPWVSYPVKLSTGGAADFSIDSIAVTAEGDGLAVGSDHNLYRWTHTAPETLIPVELPDLKVTQVAWRNGTDPIWMIGEDKAVYECSVKKKHWKNLKPVSRGSDYISVGVAHDTTTYGVSASHALQFWTGSKWNPISAPGEGLDVSQVAVLAVHRPWTATLRVVDGSFKYRLSWRTDEEWHESFNIAAQQVAAGNHLHQQNCLAVVDKDGNVLRGGYRLFHDFHLSPASLDSQYSVSLGRTQSPNDHVLEWKTGSPPPTLRMVLLNSGTTQGAMTSYRVGLFVLHHYSNKPDPAPFGLRYTTYHRPNSHVDIYGLLAQQGLAYAPDVFTLLIVDGGHISDAAGFEGLLIHEATGKVVNTPDSTLDTSIPVDLQAAGPVDASKLTFKPVKEEQ